MKTSVQLRQDKKALKTEGEALLAKARSENNRELTEEEQSRFDEITAGCEKADKEIEAAEKREKFEASLAGGAGEASRITKEEREIGGFSFQKMVRELSERGGSLTGLEKELADESTKEARALGISTSGIYLSNDVMSIKQKRTTMIAGTGSLGGDFIPTEKVGFFDALYAQSVMDKLGAPKMTGLTANTDLPGFSAGVTVGWETEVSDANVTNPTVANRTLRPKRLAAFSDISKQLLIQTNGSIEAYLLQSYMNALRSALEAAYINGSTPAPTGILGTSGTTTVSLGTNGGALTYAKVLELVATMGQANVAMENLKWLTNFKVVSSAKQIPIVSGQAAMLMSYQMYYTGTPNVLDGMPVCVTSNVPSDLAKGSSTSTLSAMILGDWANNSMIGQFGGLDIVVDPYSQAVAGSVRVVVNQFVDIAFKQPAAFGTFEDIVTS